jgi:hypothetical protein
MSLSASELCDHLRELRQTRHSRVSAPERKAARRARRMLEPDERATILQKTASRCHLCGGTIAQGESWQADHVLANSAGGAHLVENFLPAHALCNNYRWDYQPEEFQLILKLGVWVRTKIERGGPRGELAIAFAAYEKRRERRRVLPAKGGAGRPTKG